MASYKEPTFAERALRGAQARKKQLEAHAERPKSDDPRILEAAAERKAVAQARVHRAVERVRMQHEAGEVQARLREEAADLEREERARIEAAREAERIASEQARVAEAEALKADKLRLAARVVADEADRKAARDAKYAGRKARQR